MFSHLNRQPDAAGASADSAPFIVWNSIDEPQPTGWKERAKSVADTAANFGNLFSHMASHYLDDLAFELRFQGNRLARHFRDYFPTGDHAERYENRTHFVECPHHRRAPKDLAPELELLSSLRVALADAAHQRGQNVSIGEFVQTMQVHPNVMPERNAWELIHRISQYIASQPLDALPGPTLDEMDAARETLSRYPDNPIDRISQVGNVFPITMVANVARQDDSTATITARGDDLTIVTPHFTVFGQRALCESMTIDAVHTNDGTDSDRFWTSLQDAHAEFPEGCIVY